jgi:hypothetical protein
MREGKYCKRFAFFYKKMKINTKKFSICGPYNIQVPPEHFIGFTEAELKKRNILLETEGKSASSWI